MVEWVFRPWEEEVDGDRRASVRGGVGTAAAGLCALVFGGLVSAASLLLLIGLGLSVFGGQASFTALLLGVPVPVVALMAGILGLGFGRQCLRRSVHLFDRRRLTA